MSTSKRYDELRDEVFTQYKIEPANPREQYWWKRYAPLWRNRVGIPRLTAEAAAAEANGLLSSINLSTFRNDPDLWNKLLDAREAVGEFAQALGVDNYRRFQGEEKPFRGFEDGVGFHRTVQGEPIPLARLKDALGEGQVIEVQGEPSDARNSEPSPEAIQAARLAYREAYEADYDDEDCIAFALRAAAATGGKSDE